MSNLLLITDVARLRKIFGRLSEDKNIRLRVVNNLEKGGEELAIEKPDVVFVQTHLSGLSADILIMHLKKQLGRKRSRFVLLASPAQINNATLKPYQGWLDTSAEDGQLLSELQQLLGTLLSKPRKIADAPSQEQAAEPDPMTQVDDTGGSPVLPATEPAADDILLQQTYKPLQLPAATPLSSEEPSLEEQGVTYSPRQRLSVYSEFNSSFDSAVGNAPEPETLERVTPALAHDWNMESIETAETRPTGSRKGAFLLWLAPVVIAVLVITYLQQRPSAKPDAATDNAISTPALKPTAPAQPLAPPEKSPAAPQSIHQNQEQISDKAVLNSIAENRDAKSPVPVATGAPLTVLPDFIPRYGFDKHYGAANPGWERYKGQVTEFKLLRQGQAIKAIQVVDRGGRGVPESFMKAVLRQVTKKPVINIESSERKDGYEIQRGSVAENIKAVYYRDENGGKLRAFVLTWQ